MKRILSIIISLTVSISAITGLAANPATTVDPDELSAEEQLKLPAVPKKASSQVVHKMDELAKVLTKNKYTVKGYRGNEVLKVTIPSDELFYANTDSLKPNAKSLLKPFESFLKHKTDYKVVILAHSDDTGDETYSDDLTDNRSRVIYEYFQDLTGDDDINSYPYGMGFDEPVVDNHSVINRRQNRRIEIYIVPEDGLIARAKAGKLI